MPNDRWAPELNEPPRLVHSMPEPMRPRTRDAMLRRSHPAPGRADPYGLWKAGASVAAGFLFWALTGALGMAIGFAFGYAAGKVFG